MLKISSSALMKPIWTLAIHFLYFIQNIYTFTQYIPVLPFQLMCLGAKQRRNERCVFHHPFLGLSKLSFPFFPSTFHHSAGVKAHSGPANNQTQGKHPRNMQCFVLWEEMTFLSKLEFLPLLEVPVLSDPVKGDSCWYKHGKGQDLPPHFPPAGTEAIHKITG